MESLSKKSFIGRDVVSIDDFSTEEINYVLDFTKEINENPSEFKDSLRNKLMAPLFFEPSTRTSSSFQVAMLELGGNMLNFNVYSSSVEKGENLRDTLKTIQGYNLDVVVLRHKRDGAAKFAADVLDIPLINAGDGKNQHPTQTLLDLYTIRELRGNLSGTKITIAGDLKYGRTVHSLSLALSRYSNCNISFVSPDYLRMPRDLLAELSKKEISFSEYNLDKLESLIKDSEIFYMTRIQRERFPEGPEGEHIYLAISNEYSLTLNMLKNAHSNLKIMHPLPKVGEIEEAIDETKYAHYFQQAKNGLYVRKALLNLLIGGESG